MTSSGRTFARASARRWLSLLSLATACAATPARKTDIPAGADARESTATPARWPAEPDADTLRLVAGSGQDAVLLALVHPEAWPALDRLVAKVISAGPGMDEDDHEKALPWYEHAGMRRMLRGLLGGVRPHGDVVLSTLTGWDRSRPFAIALVDDQPRAPFASFAAHFLARERPLPTHLRLLVPASDPPALAKALEQLLPSAPADPRRRAPAHGYLLDTNGSGRTVVGVATAERWVRLEWLSARRLEVQELLDRLAAALSPPRPRATPGPADPVVRLLAGTRGAVIDLRLRELARWALASQAAAVADAFPTAAPEYRGLLYSVGLAEWMSAWTVTCAGQPEVAELAFAVELDRAVRAAQLARLTSFGRKSMAGLLAAHAPMLEVAPDALFGLSVNWDLSSAALAPPFGKAFQPTRVEDLTRLVQQGGWAAWLGLLERPVGVVGLLSRLVSEALASVVGGKIAPTAAAFELLGFKSDRADGSGLVPMLRFRGRFPQHDTTGSKLARRLEKEGRGSPPWNDMAVKLDERSDGALLTWTFNVPQDLAAPKVAGAAVTGSMASLQLRSAALAERLAKSQPEDSPDEATGWLVALLRQFQNVEGSTRVENGFVASKASVALAGQPEPAPFDMDLRAAPGPATQPAPLPGQACLEEAVAEARAVLLDLPQVEAEDRPRLWSAAERKLLPALACAKADAVTRAEADSLDRLLEESKVQCAQADEAARAKAAAREGAARERASSKPAVKARKR